MLTFKHSGDVGDIIFFLPVMRAFGGGAMLIEAASYTRQRLTRDNWCGIDKLLLQQPYVKEVREWIPNEQVDYNGCDFRAHMTRSLRMGHGKDKHLAHWMCEAHGVPLSAMDTAWLTVHEPIKEARVVFSRSGPGRDEKFVYQNRRFPWHAVWEKYRSDAVFVGTELEHHAFCAQCGKVPHRKTEDLLEAARVIAGCELFVGNQSCPHALASGFKKRIILEVWPQGPNTIDHRVGVLNVWDENVDLPIL